MRTISDTQKIDENIDCAYCAYEASPTPFPAQSLHSLVVVTDGALAPFTLWQTQTHVTRFAIRVALVHRKSLEFAITTQSKLAYEICELWRKNPKRNNGAYLSNPSATRQRASRTDLHIQSRRSAAYGTRVSQGRGHPS